MGHGIDRALDHACGHTGANLSALAALWRTQNRPVSSMHRLPTCFEPGASQPIMTDTCNLCGLPITRASLQTTLLRLLERLAQGKGAWLLTLNTEMLSRIARDPDYFELIAQADIITAD